MQYLQHVGGEINLQATLSASSAQANLEIRPHHPITCPSELQLHEDGRLECQHAATDCNDVRTQFCIDHSIALLIIEEAVKHYG